MVPVSQFLNKRKTMGTFRKILRQTAVAAGHGIDGLAVAILGGWAVGRWLDLAPESDRLQLLSLIPAPAALLPGLAWLMVRRRTAPRPTRRLLYLLLAACAWTFLARDLAWHAVTPELRADDVRIVHWNLARPRGDLEGMWAELRGEEADVYVLAERPLANVTNDLANLGFPDGYGRIHREMSVLSRYPMRTLLRKTNSSGALLCVRIRAPSGPFLLVAVDVHSHPLIQLGALFDSIESVVAEHGAGLPVVVIGDFNAPRRSRRMDPLRERFRPAYEAAGFGWPYTWPTPVPLFAIDHAWGNEHVEMLRYRIRGTRRSDHARQCLEIRVPAAPDPIKGTDDAHTEP